MTTINPLTWLLGQSPPMTSGDNLGIVLLVLVISLILKALWDLKTAPNGADKKLVLETRHALDQRLGRIEADVREVRGLTAALHDNMTRLLERERQRHL